jgi:uncharacterized protein
MNGSEAAMQSMNDAATAFLSHKRVAVTGVSRTPKTHGSNNVYKRMPEIGEETMRECAELGIKHVWMHRGPGEGSVSESAAAYGRQRGITVIDGGCPLMFAPTSDFGHRVMRVLYAGKVPKQV